MAARYYDFGIDSASLDHAYFGFEMNSTMVRDSRLRVNNVPFPAQFNQQQQQQQPSTSSFPPRLATLGEINSNRINSASPHNRSRKLSAESCTFCYKTDQARASTHRLKDELDRITCPVLLNNVCTFCHVLGHTPKYCPEVKKRNKKRQVNYHLRLNKQESSSKRSN